MGLLLGLSANGARVDLAPDDLVGNEIVTQGSFACTSRSFTDVVAQVNVGHLEPSFLITYRFGFNDAIDAINTQHCGVVDDEPRGKVGISFS